MKDSLKNIKLALEEHLSSINDNSSEIQAIFDYVQQVEVKMDKISQRLDQLQMQDHCPHHTDVSPLNQMEKKVFLVLYTEEDPISFNEIAHKAEMSAALVPECVSSLGQKGIPLQRSYFKNQLFFQIHKDFKEIQAKENVVNLSLQSFME